MQQTTKSFKDLDRKTCAIIMELVWLNLGKEKATNKEMGKSINEVWTLMTLVFFEKVGLTKRNKKGLYGRTKLGREVIKKLNNLKNTL